MVAALEAAPWDLLLLDAELPGFGAVEALDLLRARGFDVPSIVVSGRVGEERAAATIRAGARDFVPKDNLARLGAAVERYAGLLRRSLADGGGGVEGA